MSQTERFERFRALHEDSKPFIMPNAWDGLSAALLADAGFPALGSSSAAIAWQLGRQDGEGAVSRAEAIENARLLGAISGLPVNGDLEDGFGPSPEDCAATVEAAITAGLSGLGIEDTTTDPTQPIHEFEAAVARVRRAASAARGRIFLTARTDNYLQGSPDLDDTVRRLVAFAEAGADVLFAPGLPDEDAIRTVVRAVSPKAVNVLIGPGSGAVDLDALATLGVKRVSLGAALFRHAMTSLANAATALREGSIPAATSGLSTRHIANLLRERPGGGAAPED